MTVTGNAEETQMRTENALEGSLSWQPGELLINPGEMVSPLWAHSQASWIGQLAPCTFLAATNGGVVQWLLVLRDGDERA